MLVLASGLGRANDIPSISSILPATLEEGKKYELPAGQFTVDAEISIPTGTSLVGEGSAHTVLQVTTDATFNVLSISDAENVRIQGIRIERTNKTNKPKGVGVAINGATRQVIVEDVHVSGFLSGFQLGRNSETLLETITLRDCLAVESQNFGFEINHTRQLLIDNCSAFRNRLDGFKFRQQTKNVILQGGESSHNGIEGPNGNGLDAFAGGDSFIVRDMIAEHNNGSGFYVKSGGLAYENFGIVGRGQFIGVKARYNRGSGLDLNRSGGDLEVEGKKMPPMITDFVVVGGVFEENTHSGIYVRGRNVSIYGSIIRENAQAGVDLASAWDTHLTDLLISGNSKAEPGKFAGIQIGIDPVIASAGRIRISGGIINGNSQMDLFFGDTSPNTPPTHKAAIEIGKSTKGVHINQVQMLHYTGDTSVISHMPDTEPLIIQYGAATEKDVVGSVGSSRTINGNTQLKLSPASKTSGWQTIATIQTTDATNRPTAPAIGTMLFDTSLHQPIWYSSKGWVKADGSSVDK